MRGAMLAWLGKVVVLLVEGVGLDSGTTVYRERKNIETEISKQFHGICAMQTRMMTCPV